MIKNKNILLGVIFAVGVLLASSFVFASSFGNSYSRSFFGTYNTQYSSFGNEDYFGFQRLGFNESMCKAGQDFMVQIVPFGCEPAIVRSDLLEEQNVPVFCQLGATKINPLIDVDAIESVSFGSNKMPKEIAGVGFYPSRAALGVSGNLNHPVEQPILSNIGYVVIVLKQQKNESGMPDYVAGNLTAKLKYDIQNAFGIGKAQFYLPEMSDEDWEENYKSYSFWRGKGYLRAESVNDDSAVISVYNDINKIQSVTLKKGEKSKEIYIPGFDCVAGVELKLDNLEKPDTRVKLIVEGDVLEIPEGGKFLENRCKVREIENQGLNQKVEIWCKGDDSSSAFELIIRPNVKLKIEGEEKKVVVGKKLYDEGESNIYLGYIGVFDEKQGGLGKAVFDSVKQENLIVYLYKTKTNFGENLGASELSRISRKIESSLRGLTEFKSEIKYSKGGNELKGLEYNQEVGDVFGKKVVLEGFGDSNNILVDSKDYNNNYKEAMDDFKLLLESYASEKIKGKEGDAGAWALRESALLAMKTGQLKTAKNLCVEFEDRYPHNKDVVKEICGDDYRFANTEISSNDVFINGLVKTISFEGIYEPTYDEYGAEISIDGDAVLLRKDQLYYLDGEDGESVEETKTRYEFKQRSVEEVEKAIRKAGYTSCVQYADKVVNAGKKYGIDPLLLVAVMQTESNCDSNALSFAGAVGLMQLMPSIKSEVNGFDVPNYKIFIADKGCFNSKGVISGTIGKKYSVCSKCKDSSSSYYSGTGISQCKKETDDRFNAEKNIMAGAQHLKRKYNSFKSGINPCGTYYDGWDAALKGYVGLGCDKFHSDYVEVVMAKFKNLGGEYEVSKTSASSKKVVEYIQLVDVDDGLKYNGKKQVRIKVNLVSSEYSGAVTGTKVLKKGEVESFGSGHSFVLDDVNLKKVALVSVIPNINNAGTEANFSFKIGIEKRSIKLSPEQIKDKIKDLDKMIKEWTEKSEGLGKTVKTLKTACLATGAVLTIKNLIGDIDGKAIARKKVMDERWKPYCQDEINKGTYESFMECYNDKSEDIDKDVDLWTKEIKSHNEMIKKLQEGGDIMTESYTGGKVVDNKKFVDVYSPRVIESVKTFDDKICHPDDSEKCVDLRNINVLLDSKSYEKGNYDIEQLRNIELYARVLEINPNDKMAKKGLYTTLNKINLNADNYIAEQAFVEKAKSFVDKPNVFSLGNKDSVVVPYKGAVSIKSNFGKNGVPIQLITYNNEEYYLELSKFSTTKYRVEKVYDSDGVLLKDDDLNVQEIKKKIKYFQRYDSSSYKNEYFNPELRYYETEPNKGLPAIVPFDLRNGWYASIKQTLPVFGNIASYEASGRVSSFYICNVGENQREENIGGDDICQMMNMGVGQPENQFHGLSNTDAKRLISKAQNAIAQASRAYKPGLTGYVNILGQKVKVGKPAVDIPEAQCQDFMSPDDCKLLFNVCDPVICPSSRCDFGGKYPVQDVVQSGIIGSLVLCLPNWNEGIYVPVCLTGVKAGIDGYLSVLTSYRDCLQHSLETGEMVGICDEIYSIHLCEFFWRQAIPLAKLAIPKLLEVIMGQNVRGGGEYMSVASAWQNAEKSFNYFTQYYASNSYAGFKARVVEKISDEVCQVSISGVYPEGGSLLDALTDPQSPPQFHGRFDEIPYTSATVPPTSHYKVFYHIFAGKETSSYYQVYLKGDGGSSYYQDTAVSRVVDSGYIPKGQTISETKDFTAPAGYKEMCIRVNNQEECGFKQVSTSFAVNTVNDWYMEEQASETDIQTEKDCIAGTPSAYAFVSPNLQSGAEEVVNPAIYDRGIIRVCATHNPGTGTDSDANTENSRWRVVGYCGDKNVKCWLDSKSVKDVIRRTDIEERTLGESKESYMKFLKESGAVSGNEFINQFKKIEGLKDLDNKIFRFTSLLDKTMLNSDKVLIIFHRGKAYSSLAVEAYDAWKKEVKKNIVEENEEESVEEKESFEKASNDEKSVNSDRKEIDLTLDSALEKVDFLLKKYSDVSWNENPETKNFVNEICSKGILDEAECKDIREDAFFVFGTKLSGVKKSLLKKKTKQKISSVVLSQEGGNLNIKIEGNCENAEYDILQKDSYFDAEWVIEKRFSGDFFKIPTRLIKEKIYVKVYCNNDYDNPVESNVIEIRTFIRGSI